MIKFATKQYAFFYAFLGMLVLVTVVFSYFWLKAEEPVFLGDILIKTEDNQGSLDSGQIYTTKFDLKSLVDYEFFFKDKPLYLENEFNTITEFNDSHLKLPLSLDLPDPLHQKISITLQSDGGENGFVIKLINASNLHAFSWGMSVALVAVLLLFALQWKEDFFANGNKISAIILFLLFCFIFQYFCRMLLYELSGVFNAYDTNIYWAVGRGIVNGIPPYAGLFEIKPPGIFVLSALSFYFFDSPILTHIAQVFVLLIIAIIPLLAYILHSKEKSMFGVAFSVLLGMLLALYCDERSGQVEAEPLF